MVETTSRSVAAATPRPRRRRWPYVLGVIVLAIVVVAVLFRWDWFLPFVERRASATLGRRVTAQHMHVQLGRVTRIIFDDVHIANPAGWPKGGDFATAQHLAVSVNLATLLRTRQVVVPLVAVDHPVVGAEQLADGQDNWGFSLGGGKSSTKLGEVQITDGAAHVVDPRLHADFQVAANTTNNSGSQPGAEATLHATAKGTYAGQPITGEFTGGALLSLRDAKHPYPVDLHLANGPTRASLVGTVQDPLSFQGANLKLALEGPNMELLYPLSGIPTPPTPPYRFSGNLDYDTGSMKFTHVEGSIGKSDVSGAIAVTTTGKPVLDATLASRRVELQDLGGFIGGTPGTADEAGETPRQRAEERRAAASPKLIPNTPVSLPKLNSVDVHLHYKAEQILGRRQPLDDMVANLDIVNGTVTLHPLSFGIGGGQVTSQITLEEEKAGLSARADVEFQSIPVDKLLLAAGVGHGAGTIGGRAVLNGTGTSLAGILGHGSGEVKLYMARGGEMSALLVDLSGLEFGNALLSALGLPRHAQIDCLVADAKVQDGIVRPQPLVLDTSDAVITVTGEANLLTEVLALQLRTKAKHFSIGSLPAPIDIDGTFKAPSVKPDLAAVAARGGAAVALGIVGTPLAALIPTIQFGTSDKGVCSGLTRAEEAPHVPPREPARRAPARRR
jgi:uncharacterized protein involved in outer membrane biogenesis